MSHHPYPGGIPHHVSSRGGNGLAARASAGAAAHSPVRHHLRQKAPGRLRMEGLRNENRDVLLTPATPVNVRQSRVFSPHPAALPRTPVRNLSLYLKDTDDASAMGHVMCNVFLLSSRKNTPLDPVPGVAYYDSGREQQGYKRFLNQYLKERGVQPELSNKGSAKLRDSLRSLEDLLFAHRPVAAIWTSLDTFRLVLDDASFVDLALSPTTSELVRVTIDPSLKSNIAQFATTATGHERTFLLGLESQQVALVRVHEALTKKQAGQKLRKRSDLFFSQLPAPILSSAVSCRKTLAAVVTDARHDSRTAAQRQLSILSLEVPSTGMELVCTLPVLCDQLLCHFSRIQPRILYTLEFTQLPNKALCVGTYEYTGGELVLLTSSNLTVTAPITAFDRNFAETKLAVGCDDGSLFIFDEATQMTQLAKLDVKQPVTAIRWHRQDAVLVASFGNGDICFFDQTLSLLTVQLPFTSPAPSINILNHVNFQARVQHLEWSGSFGSNGTAVSGPSGRSHENVMVIFDRGPVVLLRVELGVLSRAQVGSTQVIMQTIANGDLNTGLSIARDLNDSEEFHRVLCHVIHHLFAKDTPGSYDLAHSILDTFRADMMQGENPTHAKTFRDSWRRMYTILFYRMVKLRQFEIAFTIANVLNDGRVFSELAAVARKQGETSVSHIAQSKAQALLGPSDARPVEIPPPVLDGLAQDMSLLAADDRADLSARDVVRLGMWLEGQGRLREAVDLYRFHERTAELERLRTMHKALTDDPDQYERSMNLEKIG